MGAPWQLDLLWGVANGLATGAIGVTLAAVIANRWFVERRGIVTGMLTASNATGQLVFLPLLGWIVTSQGWRSAALTVSIVALAVTLPLVALFLRDSPADIGLRPFGAVVDDPPIVQQNPFRAAIGGLATASRTSTFWLLTASFFVCGATTNGLIGTHLIPAAMDHGMSEVTAASLLAVIGVFDLVGTLCSGWLTDRYDPRWLLFWYYGLRGLSLLALPFVIGSSNLGLIAFVVFYGLDWVATVPPTVAITAQAFGRERVGVMFGWIFGAHQLGRRDRRLGGRRSPHLVRGLPVGLRHRRLALARRRRSRDPDRDRSTRSCVGPGSIRPKLLHEASDSGSRRCDRRALLAGGAAAHPQLVETHLRREPGWTRPRARSSCVSPSPPSRSATGSRITGPNGREVARGPVQRGRSNPESRGRRSPRGHVRRRLARRRGRHPPRPRSLPVQRRRADPSGASGPLPGGVALAGARPLALPVRLRTRLRRVFAALVSGGMTTACGGSSRGSRADDRGEPVALLGQTATLAPSRVLEPAFAAMCC